MAVKKSATTVKGAEIIGIQLPQLMIEDIIIPLRGETGLIVHKWTEKAINEILDKQLKRAKGERKPKDPQAEFLASMYRFPDGRHGFPAVGFKCAAVTACTSIAGVTKIAAKQAFRVIGEAVPTKNVFAGTPMTQELVPIEFDGEPEMREDPVKIGMGTTDLRYRAQYINWRCNLHVRFNRSVISREQLVNLFNTAGFAVGVGEWRQERNGTSGAFHVELMSQDELDSANSKKVKRA